MSVGFERALAAYRQAQASVAQYNADVLDPAVAKWSQVRDQWPTVYDFAGDPIAKAEMAAASATYDPIELRSDDLTGDVHRAYLRLIAEPVKSPTALATKLEIALADIFLECIPAADLARHILQDVRLIAAADGKREARQ